MDLQSIRILHITDDMGFGGVQKVIYQLCDYTRKEFEYISVASVGGEFADKLLELEIDHFKIVDITKKNISNILEGVKEIQCIVDSHNINVIHCHHRMAVLYAKLIRRNLKIIYNNHTIYSDKPFFSNLVLRNVNIIADGQKAKDNVTDFFKITKDKIRIIYNAVDVFDGNYNAVDEIRNEKNKGKFIVLNSARLHPQKGMQYYIEAAEILLNKGLNISFFVVGDGPLHDEIIELVKTKGLGEDIHFLGYRKDIKNVISQVDLLVLTSIYEGLPLTPMEAFSVHKAVVGTNIDGTREVIEHNVNGLLAESKNPESIAGCIEKLYYDEKLLHQYNEAAYSTYITKFSIGPFVDNYLNYYSEI